MLGMLGMLRREVKWRFSASTGGKPAAEIRQRCLSAAADFSGFCFGGTFFQREHFSPPSGNQSRRRAAAADSYLAQLDRTRRGRFAVAADS